METLCEFAEFEFDLNKTLQDGSTERDNLLSAARQGNRQAIEKLAEAPKFPQTIGYLWEYFHQLNRTRSNYGWGPVSFTYTEIEAWSRLHYIKLDRWELNAILRLDRSFLECWQKNQPKQES